MERLLIILTYIVYLYFRYGMLIPFSEIKGKDPKQQCEILLSYLEIDKKKYQLGINKLFLKEQEVVMFNKIFIIILSLI